MKIEDIRPAKGARHRKKRVGRGQGSGHGKTSCRGHKGQHARGTVRLGFEGGQMPLQRRLPKLRGISRSAMPSGMLRDSWGIVNVGQLDQFEAGTTVTAQLLKERRVVKKLGKGLRVLGEGKLSKAITVQALHFSESARSKIEAAGGKAEVV